MSWRSRPIRTSAKSAAIGLWDAPRRWRASPAACDMAQAGCSPWPGRRVLENPPSWPGRRKKSSVQASKVGIRKSSPGTSAPRRPRQTSFSCSETWWLPFAFDTLWRQPRNSRPANRQITPRGTRRSRSTMSRSSWPSTKCCSARPPAGRCSSFSTPLTSWPPVIDQRAGPGTHPNATQYDAWISYWAYSGQLRDVATGRMLPACLEIGGSAVVLETQRANPALGTPLSSVFQGFVDFGSGLREGAYLKGASDQAFYA